MVAIVSAYVKISLLALAGMLVSACTAFEKKQQAGAVVEVQGHYLYLSTLDSLTLGLHGEDSMRVAQQYINQWAKDVVLYEEVRSKKADLGSTEIDRMVEDYRRALYTQAYEEYLVRRRMPKTVPDSTALVIYTRMPERFQLDESIMRGILVIVPTDAPKIDKLRKWLAAQSMDEIEKYAYQNASGYELFTDRWMTTTEMMQHVPVERTDLENRLKSKNQIELADSTKTYLLQVTDKRMRGEQMPFDYARPEIDKIVLSERQVDFLQKERERLYNEAIQKKKVIFYE
jgi:hypothetical protein